MLLLTREQLEERLAALHLASLELVSDLSLETVLERIAQFAREQAGARYAALGVMDDDGDLIQFIPIGMPKEQMERIAHAPLGLGVLGAMRSERKAVRIQDILQDPRSIGFPENHPEMHSFLGVPILQGEKLLGQIYLTDKEGFSSLPQRMNESSRRLLHMRA